MFIDIIFMVIELNKIAKIVVTIIIFGLILIFYIIKKDDIESNITYLYNKYLVPEIRQELVSNDYIKKEDYEFVQIYNDTNVTNKKELKNAIYTFLDAGYNEYKFKCDTKYENCITDTKEMVNNKTLLTDISNFVHPYNTFNKIKTSITNSGIVTLKKTVKYDNNMINALNKKVDEIYKENYDSSKSVKENIKTFHDYIINNTSYDKDNVKGSIKSASTTAYGVLFNKKGICSGYTDAMQLFLEKMGVKNYRISSTTHEWNLVYVEGKWLHLDLTWDDPITSDDSSILKEDYFLIDTNTLMSKEDGEHNFDSSIYKETKSN